MTVPDGRMSTTVVTGDWLSPDERDRALDEDYEAGPVALSDTSLGLFNQAWKLTYDSGPGDLIVTPEITGGPTIILTGIADVTQCTLAFDQNGRATLAYTANNAAFLYWFDTDVSMFVITPLDLGVTTPTLCLDDKRITQTNSSDILLWYTIEATPDVWTLYHREQRDRFGDLFTHNVGVPPFLYKVGMHNGLRVQLGASATIL
jgi:hypothetical protein